MLQNDPENLNANMLHAHEQNDCTRLLALYTQAANQQEAAGETDAACFYLTHAYVFALESGDAQVTELHQRLKKYGREE